MHSPKTTPTAILFVDLQLGLTHPTAHGAERSTPTLISNVSILLWSARKYNEALSIAAKAKADTNTNTTTNSDTIADSITNLTISDPHPILIIHIHHHSLHPTSLLHPSALVTWFDHSALPAPRRGIEPMFGAEPQPDEPVLIKKVNSAFIGTDLEQRLRDAGIKQVLVAGMTTEHCVSTTVRMAANLNVVGDEDGFGERGVVLVEDACACFGSRDGKWDAETVHRVEIEALRGEFCEVVTARKAAEVFESIG